MMSAQTYYETQWKKIEQNYKQGLYKSNLPIILEIQNRAIKEDNAVQLIKSLKAQFSIVNQTQDDTQNDAASQFFAKLQSMNSTLKGEDRLVFKVLLGEFFQEYYDNESWEINQRTNINNQDFAQIETWSKLDFKNFLSKNYAELEAEKAGLKEIKMAKYKEIFYNAENLEYFPTLFDWNASQQIEFLRDGQLFTPNELKANHPKINAIFDELIAGNAGNPKLYFQHQKLLYNCDFTNCEDRLVQLQNLFNSATEGEYKVVIAEDIVDELLKENKHREALLLIDSVKKLYPKSNFLNNLKNKENSIVNPSLIIHYETETQSNGPIHIVAEHKNVDRFSLNIYHTDDLQGFMNHVYDSYRNKFASVKKTLVRKETYDIQNQKDYKTYKTSYETKPLPSGIYLVEYVVENAINSTFYFIASENRVVDFQKNDYNKKDDIERLVNRENGKEIANSSIDFYEYANQKPLVKTSVKTDEKGTFVFPKSVNNDYYRYYLLKSSGNNFQLVNHYGNRRDYDYGKINDNETAQIFLDRAIYRPGQTVYFKVIATALNGATKTEKVAEKVKLNIILNDANGEEISTQTLTTNEFGSVNGTFTLPKGKLNGDFSIEVDSEGTNLDCNGYKNFKVEEYKRPKFEVTFEPIKDEYKYGQTIELKGKAVMFSGVPLSNATVNYEIKKHNIRWMYFWSYPRGNDNENSILGSVKTNEKGEFTIKVDLKKDETLDGIQVDNYEIEASVTDINGETQSTTENVKVASVTHFIKADNIGNTFADDNVKVKVETKNYNEHNLKKSYNVKLAKLQEPQRIFRDNFKSKIQDLPQLSESEFIQKFPHDFFDKNDDIKNWKTEKIVLQRVENSPSSRRGGSEERGDGVVSEGISKLDLGKLEAGVYKLELYNIEGKDTIKSVQHFQVWDKRFLKDHQKPFLEVIQPKDEFKRGEKAKIYVYSAIPDALVNVFVQNGNGETKTETHKMKNGVLVYEVPVPTDEIISQLNVQFQMVAFNDVQTKTVDVKIKNEKKNLRIETVTFRDKLQPNSKEKWSVKILGDDKEKINAEVLANMYDTSLDQFAVNKYSWQTLFQSPYYIVGYDIRSRLSQQYFAKRVEYLRQYGIEIPEFNWFDGGIYGGRITRQYAVAAEAKMAPAPTANDALAGKVAGVQIRGVRSISDTIKNQEIEEVVTIGYGKKKTETSNDVKVRQNLNETAFFYPNLTTDKDGNVNFEFTSPEALTKWKLMFLAHTKDARAATLEKEVVTQKEFSVTPNYPRFLREGDELNLQSKLSNLTTQQLNGSASLQILDALTNEDISSKFGVNNSVQNFNVAGNENSVANWKIKVPNDVSSIILKVVAKAGNFSDGEQKAIAVLPNRMLVTDAQPIFVKEGQTKTFILKNLAENTSTTATNVSNSLELTTNPIWEIMFALPSLKDDQNLSADVQFNKWFADVLASEIFKANPRMKAVFDEYQNKGLLTSNLEKNQELKQLLLEETPWVLESKNETEQMQKLARIFDANSMRNSINQDWDDLKKLQNPDGGFSWYAGYPSSYYNSLYILKNLGRINEWLKGNVSEYQSSEQKEMVSKLVNFVDNEVNKYYRIENANKDNIWNNFVLDYLDTRHYWENQYPLKNKGATLKTLVIQKAPKAEIKDFTFFGLHRAALLFENYKLTNLSKKLMTYLKETSTTTETQGIYWKQNLNDWGWYSSKTVNHAGALEAFSKLTPNDANFIEEMKIWLITQKEVSSWDTSRSTAEVIYTILNSGKSWTSTESDKATIVWGGKSLENADTKATGYVKSTLKPENIDKNLAAVTVTKPGPGIVQGGLFWQYYEDLDKIKSSETYISITKELYRKIKTENGEELQKITATTPLKVGDKVTVRMILNTDRNMEFIHLKDMRAAGFEPLDVISGYQWKNNLGYYQSTKDASTNFYIENMPKGKYVFEYDYVANASGKFANGITTLQNYYAPQMNAHTQGTNVVISD